MIPKLHDVVRIKTLKKTFSGPPTGKRHPMEGDLVIVVHVYHGMVTNNQIGYEVECIDDKGKTLYVETLAYQEVEFSPE